MKPVVAVAMSGGIDSLAAAVLLRDRGHPLLAVHFDTGYAAVDPEAMRALARRIDIPLKIIDLKERFREQVVSYFIETYRSGRTPNPCLVCNPAVKFGLLAEAVRAEGAVALATGHYARVDVDADGNPSLHRGADRRKDQSYFLAFLDRDRLAFARFPLGRMTKAQVRAFASERGLAPLQREESQDICFIRGGGYGDFLAREAGLRDLPGPIEDTSGRRIGEHRGLHRFTVGQRRGIDCPAPEPYYVVRIDPSGNRLVVGGRGDLLAESCEVRQVHWVQGPPAGPVRARVQVRYRHHGTHARIEPLEGGRARIRFDLPQSAVTPGQGVVFYRGDEVLGGGWID